jgi:hypothetical protein
VASVADEYRRRAQQCLKIAGTFRDREARLSLSHMGAGLAAAGRILTKILEKPGPHSSSKCRFSPRCTRKTRLPQAKALGLAAGESIRIRVLVGTKDQLTNAAAAAGFGAFEEPTHLVGSDAH